MKITAYFLLILLLLSACELEKTGTKSYSESEPNDYDSSANLIKTDGTKYEGELISGDRDVFYFDTETYERYDADVNWVSGSSLDLVFAFYDSTGSIIGSAIDSNYSEEDESGWLETNADSGTVYIAVWNYYSSSTGSYTIEVTRSESSQYADDNTKADGDAGSYSPAKE